jgi:hypothetical protein
MRLPRCAAPKLTIPPSILSVWSPGTSALPGHMALLPMHTHINCEKSSSRHCY